MRLRIGMRQVFWFSVAGGLAFLTAAAIVTALTHYGWLRPEVARLPSFLAAVFVTWIVNRFVTFRTGQGPSFREFFVYLLAMSVGLAVNYATYLVMLWFFNVTYENPVLALIPASLAGTIVNFATSKKVLDR